ncbi:flagellar hook-associated protein FlgK [Pseudokineococcus basanitobsidens]|uniref:Flagellar hook-associated protein 1 n=1 Tax=Pseudokineococcus basanitobsidens TaxID=1926649 RepID=A0ABU8RGE9_9ACTN
MSTFQGLSIALSSLQTQRRAMDVAGQNVANAATPGYTRQRVDTAAIAGPRASLSDGVRGWTTGSGVTVTQVARLTDRLAAGRLEVATGDAALASARAGVLSTVEGGFAEPGDSGLTARLGAMWGAWSGLSEADPLGPTGDAARVTVAGRSEEVAASLRQGAARTTSTWSDVRGELGTLTTEVNSLATSVADLNRLIVTTEGTGAPAHELADQRDELVRRLSTLVGATSSPRSDSGAVDVVVGGQKLVDGGTAAGIAISGPAAMDGASTAATTVTLGGSALAVGGTAAGLTEALTTTLPGTMAGYDRVAAALATQVNGRHGDPAVFTATDGGAVTATTITASIAPADIKAGNGDRDVSIAAGMASLSESTAGPDAAWRTFVVTTAGAVSAADVRATATATARDSAQGVLTSSTGVDIDSEMVDLLTFQRAYEGAARVMTAVDEMLDTLINRTGVVGR